MLSPILYQVQVQGEQELHFLFAYIARKKHSVVCLIADNKNPL